MAEPGATPHPARALAAVPVAGKAQLEAVQAEIVSDDSQASLKRRLLALAGKLGDGGCFIELEETRRLILET
eukprot:6986228-Lingulodinium_polyedra.AAC.1